jgi:hypothetical protein
MGDTQFKQFLGIEDNYPLDSKFQLLIMEFHRCYVPLRLSRNGYTAIEIEPSATQLSPIGQWIKIEGACVLRDSSLTFPRNLPSVDPVS